MTNVVEIWTDGACRGNPGPGGWGAVLKYGDVVAEIRGSDGDTTNNRMELQAVIEALEALKRPCTVVVRTDSKYVQNGITKWIAGWQRNNWKTAAGSPVKNKDLWMRLQSACNTHQVGWEWVKGHNGDQYNERADTLATSAICA